MRVTWGWDKDGLRVGWGWAESGLRADRFKINFNDQQVELSVRKFWGRSAWTEQLQQGNCWKSLNMAENAEKGWKCGKVAYYSKKIIKLTYLPPFSAFVSIFLALSAIFSSFSHFQLSAYIGKRVRVTWGWDKGRLRVGWGWAESGLRADHFKINFNDQQVELLVKKFWGRSAWTEQLKQGNCWK